MDRAWLNAANNLEFKDPADYLRGMRQVERIVAGLDLPAKVKALRTNELKESRELREAALFCHGMGQRIGQTVYFAKGESHDYDFVAAWVVGERRCLAPVQLKEVVPEEWSSNASLDATILSLRKYVDSTELTVAIHVNRTGTFDPGSVRCKGIGVAALWTFHCCSADQSEWRLWGNFLEEATPSRFYYPQ